jgi:hypothetical protein
MLETERVGVIFADAWVLYDDSLEELERGKLRNAAEKAWGATKRAADALVLARTGQEPAPPGRPCVGYGPCAGRTPHLDNWRAVTTPGQTSSTGHVSTTEYASLRRN